AGIGTAGSRRARARNVACRPAGRLRNALSRRAVGRPATAGCGRARARRRAGDPLAGRAAVQSRREPARGDALRDPSAARDVRYHDALRHARPGRGDGDLGSPRGAEGGTRGARGTGRRSLSPAAHALRRRVHRAHQRDRWNRHRVGHGRPRRAPAPRRLGRAAARDARNAVDPATSRAAGRARRRRRRRPYGPGHRAPRGVSRRHGRLRGRNCRKRCGHTRGGGADASLRGRRRCEPSYRARRVCASRRGRVRSRRSVHEAELILGLLIAVAALVTIARRLGIAYPIFLVIGGLVLGLVPGVPRIQIDPDVIFLIVLPPLLYIAGYFTPIRSLRENLGTISSVAVGLVVVSAADPAAVAHRLGPGMGWSAAIARGALVAPAAAIAATAIMRRFAVPRQVVTILEGESLLNDATALTLYGMALTVAAGAAFSATTAVITFA